MIPTDTFYLKMIHSCFPIFLIIVLISIFQKIHFTVIIKNHSTLPVDAAFVF